MHGILLGTDTWRAVDMHVKEKDTVATHTVDGLAFLLWP